MTANPYEPFVRTGDGPNAVQRFWRWMRSSFPVRVDEDNAFIWLLDVLVALLLWLVGCCIAGASSQVLTFLEPIAYPVGLMIGWFPIGMWMHYCGVWRFNSLSAAFMIAFLLVINCLSVGMQPFRCLPLSFAILAIILPCENLLGKMILGRLPSSSTRKQREQTIGHEALDRPL